MSTDEREPFDPAATLETLREKTTAYHVAMGELRRMEHRDPSSMAQGQAGMQRLRENIESYQNLVRRAREEFELALETHRAATSVRDAATAQLNAETQGKQAALSLEYAKTAAEAAASNATAALTVASLTKVLAALAALQAVVGAAQAWAAFTHR